MPSKDWEETKVTISRKELADIISKEIVCVLAAANEVGDNELTKMVKDLLLEFSASVASEIFKDTPDERKV